MDINKVIAGLSSSGVLGGLAGGAVSGALLGNKKARKTAGTLLKVGGIAALGGLAWKAYQGYQAAQGATGPQPVGARDPVWQGLSREGFVLESPDDGDPGGRSVLLVQAMAAAAHADGHLDVDERRRILQRVEALELTGQEKALVFDVLNAPPSLGTLCERVDCPELAAEVYLSSLLATDREAPEAKLYLDALAFRLGLPEGLVAQLQDTLEGAAASTDHAAA